MSTWIEDIPAIDWTDTRQAYRRSRDLLRRVGGDPRLLGDLVRSVGLNAGLLDDCDHHPVMDRITLLRDDDKGLYLRLHMSRGVNEIMPHDHKYGFTTMILYGAYVHVWRRRTANHVGEFTSNEIAPGMVTIERPGSCYCLQHTLVHQTIMQENTVTLFLRGPQAQPRSFAASDMLQTFMETYAAKERETADLGSTVNYSTHTAMNRQMTFNEYSVLTSKLKSLGVIC